MRCGILLQKMTVGKYHDTSEYDKCCDDLHRRRCHIVEDIVEDETREWESELKNSRKSRRDFTEATIIRSCREYIWDKYEEEYIGGL